MRRPAYRLLLASGIVAVVPAAQAQTAQPDSAVLAALVSHQYNLDSAGQDFLVHEAERHDFFLLGELHGDNEIPALLTKLWPGLSHGRLL